MLSANLSKERKLNNFSNYLSTKQEQYHNKRNQLKDIKSKLSKYDNDLLYINTYNKGIKEVLLGILGLYHGKLVLRHKLSRGFHQHLIKHKHITHDKIEGVFYVENLNIFVELLEEKIHSNKKFLWEEEKEKKKVEEMQRSGSNIILNTDSYYAKVESISNNLLLELEELEKQKITLSREVNYLKSFLKYLKKQLKAYIVYQNKHSSEENWGKKEQLKSLVLDYMYHTKRNYKVCSDIYIKENKGYLDVISVNKKQHITIIDILLLEDELDINNYDNIANIHYILLNQHDTNKIERLKEHSHIGILVTDGVNITCIKNASITDKVKQPNRIINQMNHMSNLKSIMNV